MDDFGKNKNTKDGKNCWCKSCANKDRIRYYHSNQELEKSKSLTRYHCNSSDLEFRTARNARQRKFAKEYTKRPETRVLIAAAHKRYMSKMENRISRRVSFQVWYSLRLVLDKSNKKNGKHWQDLVGWSTEQLIPHLEAKFTDGMTWDNYGGESGWQIDHITPRTWFKIQAVGDDEFKKCWALENLQPKWLKDNASKGNRFAG
jgi:hypothetical protein